jgi:hypothetical protein
MQDQYPASGDYRECKRLYSDANYFRKHAPEPEPNQEDAFSEVGKFMDIVKNENIQRYVSTRINFMKCRERFWNS